MVTAGKLEKKPIRTTMIVWVLKLDHNNTADKISF
jgi:hypothetical protein